MHCPHCDSKRSQVYDSKPSKWYKGHGCIRRHRKCYDCKDTFTTYEMTKSFLEEIEEDLKDAKARREL